MSSMTTGRAAGRTTAKVTERGRRTRRRLLDAAEVVFAELGYHDASIVKIVEHAGVAQGTFYLYFRSKHEIFEELVTDLNSRVRETMSKAAEAGSDRLDAERRGFAAFFKFTADHPALYRVIREAEFAAPAAMHRHYERIIEGYVRGLTAAMDAGEIERCDPTMLAWALIAVGQLVGMRWIVWDGRGEIPDDVFEQCMVVIGRMLGKRQPPVAAAGG